MGLHRMGPPEAFILALHDRSKFTDFVETGTYRGDTAAWAAGYFERVTTIELSPAYHAAAHARFRGQPKVRTLVGDSLLVLNEVVSALAGPALFWLDAHWSGLDTAGRENQCPLLREIAAINASPVGHAVLVDDARLFCAPPPHPLCAEQWPDLAATIRSLSDGGRRHVVLFEDIFAAVPVGEKDFISEWLQAHPPASRPETRFERWCRKLRS